MIAQTFLNEWTVARPSTKYIIVHTRERPIDAKSMDNWFRTRGYLSCGFHFCVTRGGIYETRSHTTVGAHLPGFDAVSVALAILGWAGKDHHLLDPTTKENFHTALSHVADLYTDSEILPATKLRNNNGGYEPFEELVYGSETVRGKRLPTSRGM